MILGPSTFSALCNTSLYATVILKVHTNCYERFYSYVSQYQKPLRDWSLNKELSSVLTIQSNPSAHTHYKRQLQMRH